MDFSWERLKPVFDAAPVVVFARDAQGRYLYVNRAFEALIGKSLEEIRGRSLDEVLPPEVAAAVRDSDRQVLEERKGVVFEAIGLYGSGRRTLMNFKFPLIGADGEPDALFGFGTDVTERRRREEALQAAALAVSSAKGDAVFQELTRYLAVILSVEVALIGRFTDKEPRTVQTLGLFGGGAHREDLEHRLDQVLVGERPARDHGDDAQARAGGVLQRVARVAHRAFRQVFVLGKKLGHVARHHGELAACHRAAGRDVQRVGEVLAVGAAAVDAEGAQGARRPAEDAPDQRELHVEDGGEIARQLLEHALALRARGRERGRIQGIVLVACRGAHRCSLCVCPAPGRTITRR